jgi:hypothetical protein
MESNYNRAGELALIFGARAPAQFGGIVQRSLKKPRLAFLDPCERENDS